MLESGYGQVTFLGQEGLSRGDVSRTWGWEVRKHPLSQAAVAEFQKEACIVDPWWG